MLDNATPLDVALTMLRTRFGFGSFRPGQAEVIGKILAGRPILAVMPTGAGKSLCYQVPALVADRLTVVVSPLIALIDNQVAGLAANGIAAERIHSGRSREDNVAAWRAVSAGRVKILYLSPERLLSETMLAALHRLNPWLFVIDEAHCISKWGVSFRPEYGQLASIRERFPDARIAAFTATADAETRRDIARQLFDGDGDILVQGFDRPNLWLGVAEKIRWREQLLAFLKPRQDQSGIVYCLSRQQTEDVAAFLTANGHRALPYHAGMEVTARSDNQESFMADETRVMVATIAFGMGIDKANIRFVFHLNLPGSMEAYYQEIGRAGRDGAPAEVFMIYGLDDIRQRRAFIEEDGEDEAHQRREHKRLDALLAYCEATRCRRSVLLAYFGETSDPCGNCDVCQSPPSMRDATIEAQKLFSAVYRTGERFGAAHVIDVVMGKTSDKTSSFGHERLPTFGVGADRPRAYWQSLVRQAVAGGHLSLDIGRFGALKLTPRGVRVLRGEEKFEERDVPAAALTRPSRQKAAAAQQPADEVGVDMALLGKLKALRRDLARGRKVPAYVIFTDRTLVEMTKASPASLDELAAVSGVGPVKLKEFGEDFLAAIATYRQSR